MKAKNILQSMLGGKILEETGFISQLEICLIPILLSHHLHLNELLDGEQFGTREKKPKRD